ncbi:hypothetical protein TNCV_1401421 [Trichonephila clavipes]|nr:hypothetical protein TNCV_1401421 [Trichonephila clavipes]
MARSRSPPFGVVWQFRERDVSQMSSSSLDHGSKLRGPSPIAIVLLYSATLMTHPSQFNRRGKYSPVPCAPVVSATTAHKTFGPTDLTSTYSVCTRRVFGGIELKHSGLDSDALSARLLTAHRGFVFTSFLRPSSKGTDAR